MGIELPYGAIFSYSLGAVINPGSSSVKRIYGITGMPWTRHGLSQGFGRCQVAQSVERLADSEEIPGTIYLALSYSLDGSLIVSETVKVTATLHLVVPLGAESIKLR